MGLGVLEYVLMSRNGESPRQKVIEPRPELGKMEKLGSFLVNLSDTEETHYLRSVIEIEQNFGSAPEFGNEIGNRRSQLRDIVIATLAAKNSADLRTPEGKESLEGRAQRAHQFGAGQGPDRPRLFHRVRRSVKKGFSRGTNDGATPWMISSIAVARLTP